MLYFIILKLDGITFYFESLCHNNSLYDSLSNNEFEYIII